MDVRTQYATGLQASEVNNMETILYITSNAIHVYAIYIFLDSFLGKSRLSIIIKNLSYALFFIISTAGWLMLHDSTLNLMLNILSPLIISLQYKSYIIKKLFGAVSSCAVCMFADWASLAVIGANVFAESGLMQGVSVLILSSFFRHYTRNKAELPFRSKYSWFLVFTALGTILIGILTINDDSKHDYLIVLVLMCINFLNFYIYNLEQQEWETKHRLKLIETLNTYYRNQLTVMSLSQEKMRYLRHDFRKHLNKLSELSSNCHNKELRNYLNELDGAITESKEFSKTGNTDVDCLMNYELSLASEAGAEISYKADIPHKLNITPFDITIILGNLMDNAVYALRHTQKRRLDVAIVYSRGVVRIDIRNTFDPYYKREDDGQEHGIGLLSVNHTLRKYGGQLESTSNNDCYKTTVVMYDSIE